MNTPGIVGLQFVRNDDSRALPVALGGVTDACQSAFVLANLLGFFCRALCLVAIHAASNVRGDYSRPATDTALPATPDYSVH